MSEPAAKPVQSQSGFGTWIDHHAYSVVSGLGRLLRRPQRQEVPEPPLR